MNLSRSLAAPTALLLATLLVASVSAQEWKPAKGPLMTRWAKDVSPQNVHQEYPRPQLVREKWQNLDGLWEYALADADAEKAPQKFDGHILVPFPIESALSGVMKRVGPNQRLWYRRSFIAPKREADGRVLLHFGAVDWKTTVYVNGKEVGQHQGGYDPFSFDITAALDASKDQQELVVAVTDPTDTNWQPRGKQINRPHGIWYTPTTGIWQTVWLEAVPKSYVESLTIVPNIDDQTVAITVNIVGDAKDIQLNILDGDNEVKANKAVAGEPRTVKLADPKLWSPDSPFLYGLKIEVLQDGKFVDTVESYFGMRKISLGKGKDGITRILLNNEFVFQYGPLDQGFWPDGLYTPPSDAALKYDLEVTKELGFNMVRKHVKVESARWYHHCDKLGLLVWQDMPSGDRYIGARDPDIERTEASTKNFENEWREIIRDFGNSPAIVMWVPFNEGWGQFDTARITEFTRKLDPSRLVNATSGWADRRVGDVHDVHIYPGPGAPPAEEHRAIVLGEFGGLGLPLEGHTWQAKDNWGYRSFESKEALNAAYEQLIVRLRPLIQQGLSAAVYTQTTDVEIEVNGFLTYDREVLKFEKDRVIALHRKLYLPPPKVEEVLATSQRKGAEWAYTFDKPADGWMKPDFDGASWKTGPAGFGEPSTPGSAVRTNWKTNDIWLRRTIKLEGDSFEGLHLMVHHDEDTEVYFNGVLAAKVSGYTTDYSLYAIDAKALAALRQGENVIAVHTHQTGGGQYIDLGLVRLVEQ
jgi:hypothetical protein